LNWNKAITVCFVLLFAAVGGYAGVFFLGMGRALAQARAEERSYERRLVEARTRLEAQEKHLQLLRTDPRAVEQAIRRKLGYARGGEFIFRFEDPAPPQP
jgi:cell division protein FtsB